MDSLNNGHYLRHVTELGDARPVMTNQAIFAQNNLKLVDQGIRVNSRLYERLLKHKLKGRVDDCLRACAEFCVNGPLAGNCRIVRSPHVYQETQHP